VRASEDRTSKAINTCASVTDVGELDSIADSDNGLFLAKDATAAKGPIDQSYPLIYTHGH
jgi:hypothetical protein